MPKSFAEKINKAKLLVEAMRNNKETLPKPLTAEFIEDLAKKADLAAELNSVQEKLKADLKTQTARLDTLRKEIDVHYADAKKRIKLDFARERWVELGFDDKR